MFGAWYSIELTVANFCRKMDTSRDRIFVLVGPSLTAEQAMQASREMQGLLESMEIDRHDSKITTTQSAASVSEAFFKKKWGRRRNQLW